MADKMVSMKMSKQEAKEQYSPKPMAETESYPWGLQLNLGPDELKKLGIDKLPGVGDVISFDVKCKVRSVSASQDEGSDQRKNVSLQITDMCVEDMEETENAVAKGSRIV